MFGKNFTATDAFFVSVAERFRTYSIDLNTCSAEHMEQLLHHHSAIELNNAAQLETWVMEHNKFEDY